MTTHMENATVLVNAFYALAYLLFQHIEHPVGCHWGVLARNNVVYTVVAFMKGIVQFLKYPRTTKGGTTYHDGINAIVVEGTHGTFSRGDVAHCRPFGTEQD